MGNLEVIKSEISCSLESLYSIESSPHIIAFQVRKLKYTPSTIGWALLQHNTVPLE